MSDTNEPDLNDKTDRQRSIFGDRHQPTQDGSDIDGVILVPGPSKELLNDHQLIDYREHRRQLIEWMASNGKDPEKGIGYSDTVVIHRAHCLDKFYRWVWHDHGYTTAIVPDHADGYLDKHKKTDYSESHKANVFKALKMYFQWIDVDWEPETEFHGPSDTHRPREYLTREERNAIREAVMQWDSTPAYHFMEPDERDRWREYVADYLNKPTEEVGVSDFEKAPSFKYTSLVWASLDLGLRPIEIERAQTYWFDTDNCIVRIPMEESSKNQENWTVPIRPQTADFIDRWCRERDLYTKYDDTDRVWLTRHGNPYGSSSLKLVLEKVLDVAGIDYEDRDLTWYAVRHSTGTAMSEEEGLKAAQMQLRHRDPKTTMKYDNVSTERRRDALDRMG